MSVSKTSDHIQIEIKTPKPSQEHWCIKVGKHIQFKIKITNPSQSLIMNISQACMKFPDGAVLLILVDILENVYYIIFIAYKKHLLL